MIVQLPMGRGEVAVLFRLPASVWASSVHLVGDFNAWNTTVTPMRLREHYWEASLTLLAGKTYYYAYLLDGVDWRSELGSVSKPVGLDPPPITFVPIKIERAYRSVRYD